MEYVDHYLVGQSRRTTLFVALLLAVCTSIAAEIEVTVLDRDGAPVPNVAVYVQSDSDGSLAVPTNTAIMDQIDSRFVPHLLIVQSGTEVEFPNSDVIAHHVYSFSESNNFILPLYKGDLEPQIAFNHAGIVTLGCNIHDHMLGYILVVDSHVFSKTNFEGKVQLTADNPGGLTVSIWSPRIKHSHESLTQTVSAGRSAQITFTLKEKLRAPYSDDAEALTWNEY